MPEDLFEFFVVVTELGVATFCANVLLLSRNQRAVFLPLALFFLAQAIGDATEVYFLMLGTEEVTKKALMLISLATFATICQPYLFWSYVKSLTSESGCESIRPRRFHIISFLIGFFAIGAVLALPQELFEKPEPDIESLGLLQLLPVLYLQIMDILFLFLVAVYLWLIINQLKTYTNRLKDLFATTEDRELMWIWWIALVVGIYLVLSVVEVLVALAGFEEPIHPIFESTHVNDLTSFAITWIVALWGLRQQPGLMRKPPKFDAVADKEEDTGPKYERSALTEEHAKRIAAKIERAMTNDLVYRDPNLSLWDLAKHIGVTSAYVSQTLNTTLSSNFFDYINSWRVRDAVAQLHNSDETILVITYDVGFNSRSSFYKAFKREMGTTPSEVRAELRAQAQ